MNSNSNPVLSLKRILIFLLFFAMSYVFVYSAFACASPQRTIGVMPFRSSVGRNNLSEIVADSVVSELSRNPKFKVIDRMSMAAILQEQGLGLSGLLNPNTAARFGRISGVGYIVMGTVSDASISDHDRILWNQSVAQVTVSMKVIDSNTGTIVFADTVTGSIDRIRTTDQHGRTIFGDKASVNEYSGAAQDAAQKLVQRMNNQVSAAPISVYVADVDNSDNRVYLDVGSNKSVSIGQVFVIYQEGKMIKSMSGENLGTHKHELCAIQIDYVEDRVVSGVITSGDINGVKIGDKAIRQ